MLKYLILLLFAIPVFADTMTWVPPTQREDGTTLPQAEIAGYNVYNDTGIKINQAIITDTFYNVSRISNGPQTLFVRTMDTEGRESANSSQIIIPILDLSPPNPPTGLRLFINTGEISQ